jgi:hypothetical protein
MTGKYPRTCILCKHLKFLTGEASYSEYTPGYDAEMSCGKGHWEFDFMYNSENEYRLTLLSAVMCEDFEETEVEYHGKSRA